MFKNFLELRLKVFCMKVGFLLYLAKLVCFDMEGPRNKQPFKNKNQIICLSRSAIQYTEEALVINRNSNFPQ